MPVSDKTKIQGLIDEQVTLCPVPVKFKELNCESYGLYHNIEPYHIVIATDSDCTLAIQLSTLVHEKTHAQHFLDNCNCKGKSNVLSERHAFQANVDYALGHLDIPELVEHVIEHIGHAFGGVGIHGKATDEVQKSGSWKKLLKIKDLC